ncbi:MAG: hypothetical protein ACRDTM_11440 [Micromonosporaceae bacterium]
MRVRVLVVLAAVAVVGLVGYAVLVYAGAASPPPGVPRSNGTFSTVTWVQSHYGGSSPFRTITLRTDGSYTERFADPSYQDQDRSGQLRRAELDQIRTLATSRAFAAEARWSRTGALPECTDSSTITITMGELRVSAVICSRAARAALPTFHQLSEHFFGIAGDATPPGGA